MADMFARLVVKTQSRSAMVDVTAQVADAVRASGVTEGTCRVMVPHTTAAVTINEAADPAVVNDLLRHLERLVPRESDWLHVEGNADAHVKASLVGQSVTVPIEGGAPLLGRWQGIFLAEFDGPRTRTVYVESTQRR